MAYDNPGKLLNKPNKRLNSKKKHLNRSLKHPNELNKSVRDISERLIVNALTNKIQWYFSYITKLEQSTS